MSKTVVFLSFDDGREDTARIAYPIMRKYGLTATIHITTGFVDGTWKPDNWKSCDKAMSVNDVINMYNDGFEISLHGDKHQTDLDDLLVSKNKLATWGIDVDNIGFSVPNSQISDAQKQDFSEILKKHHIKYMRCGRNSKCYTFVSKVCFILYKFLRFQSCYNLFNKYNLNNPRRNYELNTVVVKSTDKAITIKRFIEKYKTDSNIILMLHSVLSKSDELYGKDSWCWDVKQFEELCQYLKEASSKGEICVKNICEEV